ncbi:MAG: hypothetical protein M1840_008866 [Geoglossum simile]|nr:MAG: hypothetical protein M1840_008866 [Geoglossum simile]
MEGILPALPWTVGRASLKVPYLAPPTYQPIDTSFYDFPRHNGFIWTDDAVGLVRRCETIGSLTPLLQSWLFFELLSAFLECPVDRNDFVADGFIEISREPVHDHFRDWEARLWRRSYTGKRQAQRSIESLINFALWKIDIFEEAADLFGSRDEDFDRVALSVKLLISLLNSISDNMFSIIDSSSSGYSASWVVISAPPLGSFGSYVFGIEGDLVSKQLSQMGKEEAMRYLHRQPKRFLPLPPGDDHGGRAAECLLRLFVDNGWCPYRARQLCRSYDYLILNSLASLKHNPTSVEDHGKCIQLKKCCAHNLIVDPPSEYPFQHVVEDDHDCEFVHVPREEIADIIKSGGIPLISMSLDGDLDLKVVRCTPYITYTAISHVWSDGLGNPESNAMLSCRLFRLREMIFQTYFPQFSPFHDDSTALSRYNSRLSWEYRMDTRPGRPYFKLDKKRVYFWIDTLCIPVFPNSQATEEDNDLKFRAMKHITPIFAGAFNTLVLDRGLQDTSVPLANQVSGDEFAALVLSSKWMQRGWTLEEGSLAQTCVFQLMGKPYEMSSSLKNLLPNVEEHHSPLDRAFINNRRLMPLLLNRALLDEKRQLSTVPLFSKTLRLAKLLRIPQFVWTWNSLLERSTTKPQDGLIIFANLLDFNVSSLKPVPRDERLMLLIQNCDELPLSLLYNTGPRMCIKEHPELGWIPKDIAGDHLVVGAAIRRVNSKRTDNQVKFWIDQSDSNPESILILRTLPGQHIPYDVGMFVVLDHTRPNVDTNQKYFIEIQRPAIRGPDDEETQRVADEIYGQSTGTCIVIDLTCGTCSRRGFAGRGARFYVDSYNQREMTLNYDAPLIAWTAEQWQHKFNGPQTASVCFNTAHVARGQRLVLNYDASLWEKKLARRSMLTQHPFTAKMTGIFVLLIIIFAVMICVGYVIVTARDALGVPKTPLPIGSMVIYIFGSLCVALVYHPIRARLAMHAYISWLKSFEEEWVEPQTLRNRIWRLVGVFFGRFGRLGRRDTRGATQPSINLPTRGRGNSATEFPGEIFLE